MRVAIRLAEPERGRTGRARRGNTPTILAPPGQGSNDPGGQAGPEA